jgi:GTP-binding protein YchF
MKLGIIGLPQSGKTSLFSAASGMAVEVGDFSQKEHRAIIKVPDSRLDNLVTIVATRKKTYAEVEFLDAAAFTGKGKQSGGDLSIPAELRLMDAFIIVLDNFSGERNPEKDLRTIVEEMILADLAIIENNIEKIARLIKVTGKRERARELELLEKCREILNEEKMVGELDLSDEDWKTLRGYAFLTRKPQLLVFNISEDKLADFDKLYAYYSKYKAEGRRDIAVVCARIEMELAALSSDDRRAFLDDLGIEKPVIDKVIQRSYTLLGLISFFTVGEPECRAWTIKKGSPAPKAAGAIHTDFERGFIKAEVATYDDYMIYKTLPALKAAAKLHIEGKDYIVQDGDVILFRFNV